MNNHCSADQLDDENTFAEADQTPQQLPAQSPSQSQPHSIDAHEFAKLKMEHLKRLILSSTYVLSNNFHDNFAVWTIDALLDAVIVLYDECSRSSLRREKCLEEFTSCTRSFVTNIKECRPSKDDFELVKTIGRGAFGDVVLAKLKRKETSSFQQSPGDLSSRHVDNSKAYAVKILNKVEMLKRADSACFREELDLLIHGQPEWITRMHCSFQDSDNLYFVLDYYPGGDLLTLLSKFNDHFPEEMAKFYCAEIAVALQSIHDLGYIHRDVKPDNVLLDSSGHIRLGDFGSAVRVQMNGDHSKTYYKSTTTVQTAVGTPDYISPEVLQTMESGKGSYGVECDWWSLGCTLWEMLFGIPPFYDDSLVQTYGKIMRHVQKKLDLEYPDGLEVTLLCKDILKRFLSPVEERIGTNRGLDELKEHSFFKELSFEKIRDYVPPYIPEVLDYLDTSNFDVAGIVQRRALGGVNAGNLQSTSSKQKSIPDSAFSGNHLPFIGFTYNPSNLQVGEFGFIGKTTEPDVSSVLHSVSSSICDDSSKINISQISKYLNRSIEQIIDGNGMLVDDNIQQKETTIRRFSSLNTNAVGVQVCEEDVVSDRSSITALALVEQTEHLQKSVLANLESEHFIRDYLSRLTSQMSKSVSEIQNKLLASNTIEENNDDDDVICREMVGPSYSTIADDPSVANNQSEIVVNSKWQQGRSVKALHMKLQEMEALLKREQEQKLMLQCELRVVKEDNVVKSEQIESLNDERAKLQRQVSLIFNNHTNNNEIASSKFESQQQSHEATIGPCISFEQSISDHVHKFVDASITLNEPEACVVCRSLICDPEAIAVCVYCDKLSHFPKCDHEKMLSDTVTLKGMISFSTPNRWNTDRHYCVLTKKRFIIFSSGSSTEMYRVFDRENIHMVSDRLRSPESGQQRTITLHQSISGLRSVKPISTWLPPNNLNRNGNSTDYLEFSRELSKVDCSNSHSFSIFLYHPLLTCLPVDATDSGEDQIERRVNTDVMLCLNCIVESDEQKLRWLKLMNHLPNEMGNLQTKVSTESVHSHGESSIVDNIDIEDEPAPPQESLESSINDDEGYLNCESEYTITSPPTQSVTNNLFNKEGDRFKAWHLACSRWKCIRCAVIINPFEIWIGTDENLQTLRHSEPRSAQAHSAVIKHIQQRRTYQIEKLSTHLVLAISGRSRSARVLSLEPTTFEVEETCKLSKNVTQFTLTQKALYLVIRFRSIAIYERDRLVDLMRKKVFDKSILSQCVVNVDLSCTYPTSTKCLDILESTLGECRIVTGRDGLFTWYELNMHKAKLDMSKKESCGICGDPLGSVLLGTTVFLISTSYGYTDASCRPLKWPSIASAYSHLGHEDNSLFICCPLSGIHVYTLIATGVVCWTQTISLSHPTPLNMDGTIFSCANQATPLTIPKSTKNNSTTAVAPVSNQDNKSSRIQVIDLKLFPHPNSNLNQLQFNLVHVARSQMVFTSAISKPSHFRHLTHIGRSKGQSIVRNIHSNSPLPTSSSNITTGAALSKSSSSEIQRKDLSTSRTQSTNLVHSPPLSCSEPIQSHFSSFSSSRHTTPVCAIGSLSSNLKSNALQSTHATSAHSEPTATMSSVTSRSNTTDLLNDHEQKQRNYAHMAVTDYVMDNGFVQFDKLFDNTEGDFMPKTGATAAMLQRCNSSDQRSVRSCPMATNLTGISSDTARGSVSVVALLADQTSRLLSTSGDDDYTPSDQTAADCTSLVSHFSN